MLRICGLTMRYPDGKLALADFNLTVQPGELVGVLGGNGSGKTTLLRCITRMLRPTTCFVPDIAALRSVASRVVVRMRIALCREFSAAHA